jgi:hypothetical protein
MKKLLILLFIVSLSSCKYDNTQKEQIYYMNTISSSDISLKLNDGNKIILNIDYYNPNVEYQNRVTEYLKDEFIKYNMSYFSVNNRPDFKKILKHIGSIGASRITIKLEDRRDTTIIFK